MPSYAEDRAEIENLQARYLFALDWQDPDEYAATFAEDGVLDWVGGIVEGRETIREECHGMREYFTKRASGEEPTRAPRLRHFITNTVIQVDGDAGWSRSFWFEIDNDTRLRVPYVGGYGHYEDTLARIGGKWLFTFRKIWNECIEGRQAEYINPVRQMGEGAA